MFSDCQNFYPDYEMQIVICSEDDQRMCASGGMQAEKSAT